MPATKTELDSHRLEWFADLLIQALQVFIVILDDLANQVQESTKKGSVIGSKQGSVIGSKQASAFAGEVRVRVFLIGHYKQCLRAAERRRPDEVSHTNDMLDLACTELEEALKKFEQNPNGTYREVNADRVEIVASCLRRAAEKLRSLQKYWQGQKNLATHLHATPSNPPLPAGPVVSKINAQRTGVWVMGVVSFAVWATSYYWHPIEWISQFIMFAAAAFLGCVIRCEIKFVHGERQPLVWSDVAGKVVISLVVALTCSLLSQVAPIVVGVDAMWFSGNVRNFHVVTIVLSILAIVVAAFGHDPIALLIKLVKG